MLKNWRQNYRPSVLQIVFVRGLPSAVAAFCGCVVFPEAQAVLGDTLTPYVGINYSSDDNLFRVPDGVQPGAAGRSDTIRETVFGAQFVRPIGRQRIEANVRMSKVNFNKYQQLDYSGKNADVTLYWKSLKTLSGSVGGSYAQTLAPYSDFHSTERNLRVQRDGFAEIDWRLHPSWQLSSRYSQSEMRYDLSSQKYLNRTERNTQAGVDYLAASGSIIGVQARRSRGEYLDHSTSAYLLNEDYTQDSFKLRVLWLATGQSKIELLGGHTRRSHDASNERDASGANGRLTATWSPRSALSVVASTWREFTPFEGSFTPYSLNNGASLRGTWDAYYQLRIEAQAQKLRRDFSAPRIAGVAFPGFNDELTTASLGATYQFHEHLTLSAGINREQRKIRSRLGSAYTSNGLIFNANLHF